MSSDVLGYVPDGVFTVDVEWRITALNRAAEQITGIRRQDALGRRCCDVFRTSICESACALKQTLATKRPVVNKVVYIIDGWGAEDTDQHFHGCPERRTRKGGGWRGKLS